MADDREEIARLIALAGLGTTNGSYRGMPENWGDEAQWSARILECIPTEAAERCFELADAILARQGPGPGEAVAETAWLIEQDAVAGWPVWFTAKGPKWRFSRDANEALRFSRKEDAETFIRWIGSSPALENPRATEHRWITNGGLTEPLYAATPTREA